MPLSKYNNLRLMIEAELRFGTVNGVPTFATHARQLVRQIEEAEAGGYKAVASARAVFGGCIRRWHTFLITLITEYALAGHETSRWRVQNWQQQTFGKSVATRELKIYADPRRAAGDRAQPIIPNPEKQAQAEFLFRKYKDALREVATKGKAPSAKRKRLSGAEAKMKAIESKLI